MRNYITLILLTLTLQMNAQVISDALRLSTQNYTSTGRATGLLGTMSNLGCDQFSIYSNPAGLATFRKSQLTITPGYSSNTTESSFGGNINEQGLYNISLDNLGYISAHKRNNSKWKTLNFGVSYNKLADFNQDFEYSGKTLGSISDRWKENSEGLTPDQFNDFEEGLAADAFVLFQPDTNKNIYGTDYGSFPNNTRKLYKSQSVQTEGYMGEITLGFAGNMEEKLQIGGSVGIRIMEYTANKVYKEDGLRDSFLNFRVLNYEENIFTTGTGVNFNFGMIYKPTQALRVSAAVHSPTFWTLTDNFYSDLEYSYQDDDGDIYSSKAESPEGVFRYGFKNPLRLNAGVAYIINKRGFISGEVEWTDYRKSVFDLTTNSEESADRNYQKVLNRDIKDAYSSSINYKLGAEMAYNSFRIRGAYALNQRPFANDNKFDSSYGLGIGLNENKFFIDLGFSWRKESSGYTPYLVGNPDVHPLQIVENNSWLTQANMTIGFRI